MTANQIWAIICFLLSGSLLIMALVFAVLKEKGAVLMAGFNTFSKEKRELYDCKKISKDSRNNFLIQGTVLLAGGFLSFVSFYFGIAAGIAWLVLLFKDFSLDADKAFEKYRL